MSLSYNAQLTQGVDKGRCGDPEFVEQQTETKKKAEELAALIKQSSRFVVFTGAGISTSVGIPDFRGPDGVWTKEERGEAPPDSIPFAKVHPSYTHQALVVLLEAGMLHYVISQNVDGLHLRSGLPQSQIAELHGNAFLEECEKCGATYFRHYETGSVGFKYTGRMCEAKRCKGKLRDTTLDWFQPLRQYEESIGESKAADLALCLGTSLRIRPAGNMPMKCVRKNGKPREGTLVICNLQKTHLDKHASLRFFARCDDVMKTTMAHLGLDHLVTQRMLCFAGANSKGDHCASEGAPHTKRKLKAGEQRTANASASVAGEEYCNGRYCRGQAPKKRRKNKRKKKKSNTRKTKTKEDKPPG